MGPYAGDRQECATRVGVLDPRAGLRRRGDFSRRRGGPDSVRPVRLLGQSRIFSRFRATACCRRRQPRPSALPHTLHTDHDNRVPVKSPPRSCRSTRSGVDQYRNAVAFVLVCLGVWIRRNIDPQKHRPFPGTVGAGGADHGRAVVSVPMASLPIVT